MADPINQADQAPAADGEPSTEMTREDQFILLSGVLAAALEKAYDAGINVDVTNVAFDLSADSGDVVVAVVGADGSEESQTISEADIMSLLSEEEDEASSDMMEDEGAPAGEDASGSE